jgi:hypothetical protein
VDTSDKIALVALGISGVALLISGLAARFAHRQAVAAEESNRINAGPTWRVVPTTDTKYALTNVSDYVQTGVSIDGSRILCHHANLPKKATISVGEAARWQFTMAAMSGETLPDYIYVRWNAMRPTPSRWAFWRKPWVAVPVEPRVQPLVAYGS